MIYPRHFVLRSHVEHLIEAAAAGLHSYYYYYIRTPSTTYCSEKERFRSVSRSAEKLNWRL